MSAGAGGGRFSQRLAAGSGLLLAGLVMHLVLVQPNHPGAMTWAALGLFPLELPVILGLLLAWRPGRSALLLRGALVAMLLLIVVLKAVDFTMFTALGRRFDPLGDLPLIEAALRWLSGTLGAPGTAAVLLGLGLSVTVVGGLLWWATGAWARVRPGRPLAGAAALAALVSAVLAAAEIGHATGRWSLPAAPPGAAFTARVGVEWVDLLRQGVSALHAFRSEAARDRQAGAVGLLDRLDRDLLLIFVESYGRTSFDTPLFADTHRRTLSGAEERLRGLGLSMRSAFVRAPTQGGQSWLSHATLANGLWVDSQARYGALLASGRQSLFHIAARSGFHTAAVMPQITLEWPESATMGFETVLVASDLGYAGLPFNWVTMPDQYTLAALDRLLRDQPDRRPLVVQVALGSSHAPWVPVPELVAWERIGDGRVFNAMALSGETPEQVWRDPDRVREHYRRALDYALRTLFDYVARHAADPPLIMVVGDHQAAGFIALDERPHVPVHIIGPAALVDSFAAPGWQRGLFPDPDAAIPGMDSLRDGLLQALSSFATVPVEARAPRDGGSEPD